MSDETPTPETPVATPAPVKSSHVAVPKWVLTTVAAVVGAGVIFGIGYALGDGSSSDGNTPTAVGAPFGNGNPQMPGFPGPGNQGNGNQRAPRSPNQPASGAFLGVATQQTNRGLEIIQVVS